MVLNVECEHHFLAISHQLFVANIIAIHLLKALGD